MIPAPGSSCPCSKKKKKKKKSYHCHAEAAVPNVIFPCSSGCSSILLSPFHSRLCPSTAESFTSPESSNFICPIKPKPKTSIKMADREEWGEAGVKYEIHDETFGYFRRLEELGSKSFDETTAEEQRAAYLRQNLLFAGNVDFTGSETHLIVPAEAGSEGKMLFFD